MQRSSPLAESPLLESTSIIKCNTMHVALGADGLMNFI